MYTSDFEKARVCLMCVRSYIMMAKCLKKQGFYSYRMYLNGAKKCLNMYFYLRNKWEKDITSEFKIAA